MTLQSRATPVQAPAGWEERGRKSNNTGFKETPDFKQIYLFLTGTTQKLMCFSQLQDEIFSWPATTKPILYFMLWTTWLPQCIRTFYVPTCNEDHIVNSLQPPFPQKCSELSNKIPHMISMRGFTCQRLFQDSIICQGGAVQTSNLELSRIDWKCKNFSL